MSEQIPTYDDVKRAALTLKAEVTHTPLIHCDALDEATGCRVFVKPENLQRTGSFKFRGAFNAISNLSEGQRAKGILASSSGNHAQGIAEAARMFGCEATIVMPSDAPFIKVERTRKKGAKIIQFDRAKDDREKVLAQVAEETGCVVVHPFNNSMVIAGQGTVGMELADDMKRRELPLDRVIICTGGGGLTSGVALAVNHQFPDAKIHSVEPEGFDDYRRSLESGKLESNTATAGSVCDAIITPAPGVIGFEINQSLLSEGLVVTDEEAMKAVKFAFEELKLVVEPGGAVALAAVLKHGSKWAGETIVVIISGGNVDRDVFTSAIS